MKSVFFKSVLLVAGLVSMSSIVQAEDVFEGQVQRAVANPKTLSSAELTQLQSVQYILVDGIFGGFFLTNLLPAKSLIENDWKNSDTALIRPLTKNPVVVNAEILYQQIKTLRMNSPHSNAVILAHSKGAAEVTLMMFRHPDLASEYGVQTIEAVSGPLQGTDLTDLITEDCPTMNPICSYLNGLLPSLQSFIPSVIKPLYQTAYDALSDADRTMLESRFFYVRTLMSDLDVTSPLMIPHLYLSSKENVPNDGLIPTASERLEINHQVFGKDLGIMHGDHNSLLNSSLDPSTLNYRQTFFRVLMEETFLKQ